VKDEGGTHGVLLYAQGRPIRPAENYIFQSCREMWQDTERRRRVTVLLEERSGDPVVPRSCFEMKRSQISVGDILDE